MRIIIFSTRKRKIGETIELKHRENGSSRKGTVVGLMENNPRYHNQKVCKRGLVNSGKDYYEVEIK